MKFFLNFLTYSRILLTPLIIYYVVNNNFIYAGIIFAFCSFSDLADGKIARKYDLVSGHGNYMDPLADKVLTIGALSALLVLDTILPYDFSNKSSFKNSTIKTSTPINLSKITLPSSHGGSQPT